MLKPLTQTSSGHFLEQSSHISAAISKVVLPRDEMAYDIIDEKLRNIGRRFNFPLKNITMEMYSNRRVVLLNNREVIKLPTMFPAYTYANDGTYQTRVNCTPYVPNNAQNFNERQLYAMMQYGAVLNLVATLYSKFSYSAVIQREGGRIYALTVLKVLDRMVGISTDEMHSNQILFFFFKYFNINLLGRSAHNDAITTMADGLTSSTALLIKQNFERMVGEKLHAHTQEDIYKHSFLDIIKVLPNTYDWLNRISTRGFLQNYLALFNPPSLLNLERLDYFTAYYANFASDLGIFSNDPVVVNTIGRSGVEFYNEVIRLSR